MGSLLSGAIGFLPVLLYGAAAVLCLVGRSKYPKRATFALIGFGILTFGALVSLIWTLSIGALLSGGNYRGVLGASSLIGLLRILTEIGGVAMLLMALFRSEEAPAQQSGGQYGGHDQYQPQQQYGGQQYPQQGQQYPPQGPQYPPQQPGQYPGY
ncbi:MAG: hypothetical protein GEV10_19810 [Streptosporangiales bacterium]|nr:hypothetical protein [Streptosporangiales bacterium]